MALAQRKKTHPLFILIYTLLISVSVPALAHDYVYLGGFKSRHDTRGGFEIGYMNRVEDRFLFSGNLALYDNDRENDGEDTGLFAGGAMSSSLLLLEEPVTPYLGVGLFWGELLFGEGRRDNSSRYCYEDDYRDTCEYQNVLAVYPEAGIAVDLDYFMVMAYARRYFDTSEGSTHLIAVGLSLAFEF